MKTERDYPSDSRVELLEDSVNLLDVYLNPERENVFYIIVGERRKALAIFHPELDVKLFTRNPELSGQVQREIKNQRYLKVRANEIIQRL